MATRTIDASNLEATVRENPIVILDFWASWCGPCRQFAPTFEAASEEHPDVVFGKIDTEDQQALAVELQILSIPTLMVFRDQVLLYREAGALPPPALAELLKQVKALDMDQVRKELAERATVDGPSETRDEA
jgi:thioredoxin 1